MLFKYVSSYLLYIMRCLMSSCFQYFFLKNTFKSKYGGVRARPTSSTAVHEEHYKIYNIIQFSFLFRLALVTGPDFPCQSLQCAKKAIKYI